MIITLNLLDEKRKKRCLRQRILVTIKKSIELLLFFILLIAAILSFAEYGLEKTFKEVAEQTTYINKNIVGYNQEINSINKQLDALTLVQKNYISWSPLVFQTMNALPPGIKLTQFSVDKKEKTITIKGLAADRDNLLLAQKNLAGLFFINKVESPLNNLLQKQNVEFELSAQIDLNRLSYE